MFLTNKSLDLYALTLRIMLRKNNVCLSERYNLQAYANISGKFPKIGLLGIHFLSKFATIVMSA